MIDRIREFFRDEHIGITIPVGVVTGITLSSLLLAVTTGLVIPALKSTPLGDDNESFGGGFFGLDFTIGDVTFDYTQALAYSLVLGVLALIAWWLFIRAPVGIETDDNLRECPECKSLIVADARRCAPPR
jgi:hypothetical protein